MFNSLTGTITGKFPQKVFLMTNGIEWDLTVPDSNIEKISSVGETGKIYTYLQHSDQGMCLFGFASVSLLSASLSFQYQQQRDFLR